ncbi:hypothetical protein D3C72_1583320 [compost metagenome]
MQHFQRFFEQARRRNVVDKRRQTWDRLGGFRTDLHIQLGGKAHGAKHTHRIFAIARFWIADQANHAVFQILHAADEITHREIGHAVIKAVDGEIATLGIFFDGTKDVVTQQHAVLAALRRSAIRCSARFVVTTEGGHFDNFRAKHHVSKTETTAYQTAVAE